MTHRRLPVTLLFFAALNVRAGEFHGRLLVDEKPAAGVTVQAIPYERPLEAALREARGLPAPAPIARTLSDAKGEFRLKVDVTTVMTGTLVYLGTDGGGTELVAALRGEVFDASEGEELDDILLRELSDRAGPKAASATASGSSVRGLVLSGETPVKGAAVRFEGSKNGRWVETGEDGAFVLQDVPPGRVYIVVLADGDRFAESRAVVAPVSPDFKPVRLTLTSAPVIEGRTLVSTNGRVLARVRLQAQDGDRKVFARSGADGRFRIGPLRPGPASVRADEPRHALYSKTTEPLQAGRTKALDIFLTPATALSGVIVDEEKKPIAGARITVHDDDMRWIPGRVAAFSMLRSHADGTFSARRIFPGDSRRIIVQHPEFLSKAVGGLTLPAGGAAGPFTIVLKKGLSLSGLVSGPDKKPVAGVQVIVSPSRAQESSGDSSGSFTRTGPDGHFRFACLSPGRYAVEFQKSTFPSERIDPVTVEEGKPPAELSISLSNGISIRGVVRGKKGGSIAGQSVSAVESDAGSAFRLPSSLAETAPDGTFSIGRLKAGKKYDVRLDSLGGSEPQKKDVIAPADDVEIVVNGFGSISGVVTEATSGKRVADFRVSAQTDRSGDPSGMSRGGQSLDVHSEDGTFFLDRVPAGRWEAVAIARGFEPARMGGILVEEGETRSGVELKLNVGLKLTGRVMEASSGRPIPDASVRASGLDVATDADGAFLAEGVSPGKQRVTFQAAGFVADNRDVDIREGMPPLEIRLSTGGSVGGSVTSASGEPPSGASVSISGMPARNMTADSAGRFHFGNVAPGRYTLTARYRGAASRPVELLLPEGESREDLVLPIGGGARVTISISGLVPEERRTTFVSVSMPGGARATAREEPDGRYVAENVPPGNGFVSVSTGSSSAHRSVGKQFTISEGQTAADVEIAMEAGFTLTVSIKRAGQGVEGVSMSAYHMTTRMNSSCQTDSSGRCALSGLPAGDVMVSGHSRSGNWTVPQKKVTLNGDDSLDVQLAAGRLSGTVVSGDRPLADVTIILTKPRAEGGSLSYNARSDQMGRFSLDSVEPGTLTLTAQRKGFGLVKRDVTVAEDGGEDLVLELKSADGMEIEVRDGVLRTPLRNATAVFFDGSGARAAAETLYLDSDGAGELPAVAPGTYTLVIGAQGYAPAGIENLPVPGPPRAVALTPGGALEITAPPEIAKAAPLCRLSKASGAPVAFALYGKPGDVRLFRIFARYQNFPAGPAVLSCPGRSPQQFTVPEGGTARIELH